MFKELNNILCVCIYIYTHTHFKNSPSLCTLRLFPCLQFSRSVMSNSLQPHGLQHARPPCPSPTPGVYPNSCPLSQWCHPTTSTSVIPFSYLQSFPTSGSFLMSHFFASGGQSIRVSASASVLNIIERTDAEAETLILWPPDAKKWLIRKDPDVGKDWR